MTARRALVLNGSNQTAEIATTDALYGVTGYVEKATTPTGADYNRSTLYPGDRWLNTTNGFLYEYGDGAWLTVNAGSIGRRVPAWLSNGTSSPIPLNSDGTVPAKLANGTVSNIPVTL